MKKEAYIEGFGTVRECRDCGVLVAGGPTRCIRCANECDISGLRRWIVTKVLRVFLPSVDREVIQAKRKVAQIKKKAKRKRKHNDI